MKDLKEEKANTAHECSVNLTTIILILFECPVVINSYVFS